MSWLLTSRQTKNVLGQHVFWNYMLPWANKKNKLWILLTYNPWALIHRGRKNYFKPAFINYYAEMGFGAGSVWLCFWGMSLREGRRQKVGTIKWVTECMMNLYPLWWNLFASILFYCKISRRFKNTFSSGYTQCLHQLWYLCKLAPA